jgi:DNA-binding CsgD family transcriptional regulator
MRRGDNADHLLGLTAATRLAFETNEPQRIFPALCACLEYEWLTGQQFLDNKQLQTAIGLVRTQGNVYGNSEFAFWMEKARGEKLPLTEVYEGYNLSNKASVVKAAHLWKAAGCSYNEALALAAGTVDNKREAIAVLQTLGANATVQKIKLDMRSSGIKNIPRGMRKSTLSNKALLTGRELDVLQLMKEGLQNKEIAGKLFIAAKTVDHHISSILFKLDVNSRAKAVNEALRQEILK